MRILVSNWPLLGAAPSLMGPATPRSLADLSFRSSLPHYYLFLVMLAMLLFVSWTIQRSRMGYYLRAINGGDRAARRLGVAVLRYKLYAMLLSRGSPRWPGRCMRL